MEYIGEKELTNKLISFKKHMEHADRMILSAKFGDGKTFFLQKVREDAERFQDYEFITIYPVNYVVSPNEDIFEYIKRDIMIQLAKLGLLNQIDLDKLITSVFSLENFKEVLAFLLSCIPGGDVYNKFVNKFFEISKKYNDEKATYEKYLGTFKTQRGGLYEDDAYTQIIKGALYLLKNGYTDKTMKLVTKKPVLIIEDLDRLDPAHLFRILNVISAHINDSSKPDKVGNKFGFDNIVIVMDYDTTQNIFEHFYGKNASYNGYMSKFLSEEPFRYSITELALPKLKEKMLSDIGVNQELFKDLRILNIKLSALSIRDIARLYDFNILNRIGNPNLNYPQSKKLSMHLPIFKLLIYMTELGMSYGDIDEDLKLHSNYNLLEYLQLIYPLYLLSKRPRLEIFEYGSDFIHVVLNKEDGIICSVNVEKYEQYSETAPSINIVSGRYAWCCQLLTNYIDMAGFNRSEGYSVPNYMPVD